MSVALIHLFCHASDRILDAPDPFQILAMRLRCTLMICQVITKLAILDVAMDVEGWDEFLKVGKLIDKIRKVFFKALAKMDPMLTADVVTMQNVSYFWVFVATPLLRQSQHSQTLDRIVETISDNNDEDLLFSFL